METKDPGNLAIAESARARIELLRGQSPTPRRGRDTRGCRIEHGDLLHLPGGAGGDALPPSGRPGVRRTVSRKRWRPSRPSRPRPEAIHNTFQLIDLLALKAVALDGLDREDEAIEVLCRALEMAAPGEWVRPFVELGRPMAELLEAVRDRRAQRISGSDRLRIQARFGENRHGGIIARAAEASRSDRPLFEALTHRERDVLELLAERLYDKEIAARLGVTSRHGQDPPAERLPEARRRQPPPGRDQGGGSGAVRALGISSSFVLHPFRPTRRPPPGHSIVTMTKEDRNATGGVKRPQWTSGPLPAVYRIVASGRLDSSWRGRLGEMEISVHESPSGASTVLEGPIRDRAELTGILNTSERPPPDPAAGRGGGGSTENLNEEPNPRRRTMKERTAAIIAMVGLMIICFAGAASAQTAPIMEMTTETPNQITTPDRVETPIGTLEFFDGVPIGDTKDMIFDYMDRARAAQVFVNMIPAVSMYTLREGPARDGRHRVATRSSSGRT